MYEINLELPRGTVNIPTNLMPIFCSNAFSEHYTEIAEYFFNMRDEAIRRQLNRRKNRKTNQKNTESWD